MRSVAAIARLTVSEGIRLRIVVVFLIAMGFIVLRLPFALEGDGTLTGRLQNFLDYSLAAVSLLLSLSTVMLAASTLAKEFQTRSLQMIVTKPVTRFQILLGKWLGITLLNVMLLGLCGLTIYGFARFIANQPGATSLSDQLEVEDVVWTARKAASPVLPDFTEDAEEDIDNRVKQGTISDEDPRIVEQAVLERKRELGRLHRAIGPSRSKVYHFENLPEQAPNSVVQVRYKVRSLPLPPDERPRIGWRFVHPDNEQQPLHEYPYQTAEPTYQVHHFLVSAGAIIDGRAALEVYNYADPQTERYVLMFQEPDALQILFRVGGFELNYVKALGLMLLRLTFLAALGLFFGTFVSFPVAVFCGLTWYVICMGQPFWLESIGTGRVPVGGTALDPFGAAGVYVRPALEAVLLAIFPNFATYSGGRALIEGLYISPELLLRAALHTLGLGLVMLFLIGWLVFWRREVADVSST